MQFLAAGVEPSAGLGEESETIERKRDERECKRGEVGR
jgi:hypothetical protein